MNRLFVYGTLRKGEANSSYMMGSVCLAEQAWVYGKMIDVGEGYPFLIIGDRDRKVYGELYEVKDESWPFINELEGYIEGEDNLYNREIVSVTTDQGEVSAFVYTTTRLYGKNDVIREDDWKVYQLFKAKPEKIQYFAYGSCMDDERFRLAGVERYFKEISFIGKLEGYSLYYTFHASDGGRADILECGGSIKGVVYTIPFAGLEYLLHREGYINRHYRPTFVELSTLTGESMLVLTFHVYEKKHEIAPPEHYATEILRGSRKHLDATYVRQLKEHFRKLNNQ